MASLLERVRAPALERTIAVAIGGIVVGIVEVVAATSFAALVFGASVPWRLDDGVGLVLGTTVIVLTVGALMGGRRGIVSSAQDGPAAVLAVVAIAAATTARTGAAFATVVMVVVVTTLLTGAACLTLGALRSGDVVRFVPYPVVGGFLAGTGWLLLKGAVSVSADTPATISTIGDLSANAGRWIPAVIFGATLLVAVRRHDRPMLIPLALVGGAAAFVVGMLVTGTTVHEAERAGLLLGPFPSGVLWAPWSARAITAADWRAVVEQTGGILTAVFVGVIGTLLNTSGAEIVLDRDLNSNDELRLAGRANVLASVAGGIPGFQSLDVTALTHRMRASARGVGLVAASLALATILFGASLVGSIPRMLVGGLLAFLGLSFLVEWTVDARKRLPTLEYAVVLVILATIVGWGLLTGVAVGLVVAVVLFAVKYSETDVVRASITGATARSNVERPSGEREILRGRGDEIHVLRLHGFVFFGTAKVILDRVRTRLGTDPPLRWLVIDFSRVSGVDSSAVAAIERTARLASAAGCEVVLTDVAESIRRLFDLVGLDVVGFAEDLDAGLERCEDALLRSVAGHAAEPPTEAWLPGDLRLAGIEGYVERLEIPPGAVLIEQGATPQALYLLQSGRLSVQFRRSDGVTMRLRTMRPGVVVGEVSMYLGSGSTANVVADTQCVVLRIGRAELSRLEREQPDVAARVHRWFAAILAERLADSLRTIEAMDR